MADDKSSGQSQTPFRRDITFDQLNALLNGANVDEIFNADDEQVTQGEQTPPQGTAQPTVTQRPEGIATFKVQQVPDTVPAPETPSAAVAMPPLNPMVDEPPVAEPVSSEMPATSASDEPTADIDDTNAASRMLRGSAWMTIGNLASRLLGALYIIPWVAMIGHTYYTSANSLFAQGYQIYSVALLIATAGLPNVLARLVAEYGASRQYQAVKQVFRQALQLGVVLGVAAGGLLFLLAGPLSQGDPNVVPVIQSLAAAVAIIPLLSMLRGYVQGFEFMGLSAASQFFEQLIRVVYMLVMTYWIMVGHHGDWVDATVQSTFAAFWGALAGILILVVGIIRRRRIFAAHMAQSRPTPDFNPRAIMLKMARQSIPVIFAGSAISLTQVIDQYTFFNIMRKFTTISNDVMQAMFSQFAFNSNKLIMLVVSLAVGMAETALPMLARAKELGNRENIADQIQFAMKLLAFIMIPASLGMVAVARPLYVLFYNTTDLTNGTLILQFASFTAILLGMYMVVLAIYQGLNDLRYTVNILILMIVSKLVLQIPLTIWLYGMGPLVSTAIAFIVGLTLSMRRLTKRYSINWAPVNYALSRILLWSLVMFAVVWPVTNTLLLFVSNTKLMQLIILIIAGAIGGGIYGIAMLKTRVGIEVLGARAQRLVDKLHL